MNICSRRTARSLSHIWQGHIESLPVSRRVQASNRAIVNIRFLPLVAYRRRPEPADCGLSMSFQPYLN